MLMEHTHYFVTANSSKGLYNLLETNIVDFKKIILLTGEFTLLKYKTLEKMMDFCKDIPCECIHSSFEPNSLDGIILRQQGIAILNDRIFPEVLKNSLENIITVDSNKLSRNFNKNTPELLELKKLAYNSHSAAHHEFACAIKVHDEWEAIYIKHMNFDKANRFTEKVIDLLLSPTDREKIGKEYHRFFGGATYKGAFDLVEQLTKNTEKRYFIKGRPGSGKSTMLKKIAAKAVAYGFDAIVYHCGFDPDSLDMVIIRPLNICIFDSTAPHEYFPTLPSDEVIDMYSALIDDGTDEKFEPELEEIKYRYNTFVANGISHLLQAKEYEDAYNNHCKLLLQNDAEKNLLNEIISFINI